jgi:hypothetical protein|tara:strand:+ start:422 stop:1042 length:621 start_codon:yes stop_codon:yes gene_type:complete
MKNQLTKIFAIFSLVFFLFSCTTECTHKENSASSCYPDNNEPLQIITYKEMAEMMGAFDNGSKKELNKYLKKVSKGKDSISTVYNWYKLDDLKQYIAYIERISKEKGIPVTGFRIYPSQYPKKYKDKKLQNRNTLIFTPTTTVDGRDDTAFEPLYSKKNSPLLVSDLLKIIKGEEIKDKIIFNKYSKLMDSLTSSSANRIKTTPPY